MGRPSRCRSSGPSKDTESLAADRTQTRRGARTASQRRSDRRSARFSSSCAARAARGQTATSTTACSCTSPEYVAVQGLRCESRSRMELTSSRSACARRRRESPGRASGDLLARRLRAQSARMPRRSSRPTARWSDVARQLAAAAARVERSRDQRERSATHSTYIDHPGRDLGDRRSAGTSSAAASRSRDCRSVYYLRASKMYDTLMQMGRWFGYRDGYTDLVPPVHDQRTGRLVPGHHCRQRGARREVRRDGARGNRNPQGLRALRAHRAAPGCSSPRRRRCAADGRWS